MAENKTPIGRDPDTAHTPTPWELVPQNGGGPIIVRRIETGSQMAPTKLRLIAQCFERGNSFAEDKANAEFLVRASNSHQDLLDALKTLYEIRCNQWHETAGIEFVKGRTLLRWPDLRQAEAAIQKAEGPDE